MRETGFWGRRAVTISPENISAVLSGQRRLLAGHVKLGNFREEEGKLGDVFEFFYNNDLELVSLEMGKNDLRGVNSRILANVISKASEVNILSATLSIDQFLDILKEIEDPVKTHLKLKKLSVCGGGGMSSHEATETQLRMRFFSTKFEDLKTQVFGGSERRLFVRSLPRLPLAMLTAVSLKGTDLSAVRAELLWQFVNKLETVNLRNCNLQLEQLSTIFQAVDDGVRNLRELDVFGNDLGVLISEPEFIASAVCKLEKVALQENYRGDDLWEIIGSTIGQAIKDLMDTSKDVKLKSLELDVASAFPLLMPRLESLTFTSSNMSGALVTVNPSISRVKKLSLVNCTDLEETPAAAIRSTIEQLDHFVLKYTVVTSVQFVAIMFAALRSLKSLEVEGVPICFPPQDFVNFLVRPAEFRLEKLSLLDCHLSASHVNVILDRLSSAEFRDSSLTSVTLEYDHWNEECPDERILKKARESLIVKIIKKVDPLSLKEDGNEEYGFGDFPVALSKYTEALKWSENEKERATILKNRAAVHLKMENYEAVIADCSRALEVLPEDGKALYRRCLAYESLGKIDLAYNDAKRAKTVQSNKGIEEALTRLQKLKKT